MGKATKTGGVTRITKVPQGATKPVAKASSGPKPYNQLKSRGGVGRMYDGSGSGGTSA